MYSIRKYRPPDRERLRYIAMETAWDSYKKSPRRKETVAILFNDYFTKYESENIFVAVNEDDIPFGYIICSVDWKKFIEKNMREFLPKAARLYPPVAIVQLLLQHSLKKIKDPEKRVHFHIDLLPEAQHSGLGTRLIDALRAHLYENGVEYLCGCNVNPKAGSYIFYKKYGFKTYCKSPLGFETIIIKTKETGND